TTHNNATIAIRPKPALYRGLRFRYMSSAADAARPAANWLTARVWLTLHGQLPWRLVDFLDDAHHRTVLVQMGGACRFGHTRLREHLAVSIARPDLPQSSNTFRGGPR